MRTRIVLTLALTGAAALAPAQAPQFVISTYAGGSPSSIPVAAVNAAIGQPQGVTTDAAGNVYFISLYYGVFKLDRGGILTRIAGNSNGSYSGDDGPAINAHFSFGAFDCLGGFDDDSCIALVAGVAVDSVGNVYVADSGNSRVRKISPNGIITTVAGNGTSGHSGDGGPATHAQLVYPAGLAVDRDDNLYIADRDSVRKVSPDGNITSVTAAAAGSAITADSAGNLYIARDGQIRKIAPNGVITLVAAEIPSAMTVDSAGNLYLAEGGWVRKITPAGILTTVAGNGACGYSGDGGPVTGAQVCATGLAVDSEGSLYVTDAPNQRVRKISAGVISTAAGNGTCCFSGDGGPARTAMLNFFPWGGGMAVDAGSNLYIADGANGRVREISSAGIIATVAGSGDEKSDLSDGGPATSAHLSFPSGVAVDSVGTLYIADASYAADFSHNRIRKVSPVGTITTVAQSAGRALAVDGADNLYYIGAAGISKLSPSGVITTVVPSAQLNVPFAMAVDRAGNLYFAEIGYIDSAPNYRVRKLSPDRSITIVAGNGTAGYSGDGGPAAIAQINGPVGLAVDSAGNLYIADSFNGRIRMVSPSGIITTIAGNGGAGSSGDGGPATNAQFVSLSGLTIDGAGNLYAADQGNNSIRLLQPASSAILVSGVGNAASNLAGAIAPGELVTLTGVALGPAKLVSAAPGSNGVFAAQLAGTTVQINDTPATLIYTSATQVAAVVPDSVSGGTALITVTYQGHTSPSFPVPVAPTAPGIFTANATGRGYAATINQKGSIDTAAHWEGDLMTLFLTGAGRTIPAVAIYKGGPLPITQGTVPGVMQIKVPIPPGTDCDLPVVFQVGNAFSQPGVAIPVDLCI